MWKEAMSSQLSMPWSVPSELVTATLETLFCSCRAVHAVPTVTLRNSVRGVA